MNNLTLRILSASVLAPLVLFLTFKAPPVWFFALLSIIVIVGFLEFFQLKKTTNINKIITIFMSLFLLILMMMSAAFSAMAIILLFIFLIFWAKNTYLVFSYPHAKHNSSNFLSNLNAVFLFTPLFILWGFVSFKHQDLILLLFLIVWGADSFAYIFGKLFGKRKLAPFLSNGKTVEGVIGGVFASVVLTLIWMQYNNIVDNYYGYILLTIITALISVVGDLYQSIYKRQAGVSDSGNIIPGHGGIWDRIDGLLAAIPIFTIGVFLL